jgi:hypothetical protein
VQPPPPLGDRDRVDVRVREPFLPVDYLEDTEEHRRTISGPFEVDVEGTLEILTCRDRILAG